ncbi:MAG: DUF423 domain-containing protein [Planctomycetota bacterium]
MSHRFWITTAGVWGAISVALGAFGAHGLPKFLEDAGFSPEAIASRLATYETGARYQLYAALALLAVSAAGRCTSRVWSAAAWQWLVGSLIFSGCCYALAIVDGYRWLGAIVPIGGVLMITGWLTVAVAAKTEPRPSGSDQ